MEGFAIVCSPLGVIRRQKASGVETLRGDDKKNGELLKRTVSQILDCIQQMKMKLFSDLHDTSWEH